MSKAHFKHIVFLILAGLFLLVVFEGAFANMNVEEELTSGTELMESLRDMESSFKVRDLEGGDFGLFLPGQGNLSFRCMVLFVSGLRNEGAAPVLSFPRYFLLFHQLIFYA